MESVCAVLQYVKARRAAVWSEGLFPLDKQVLYCCMSAVCELCVSCMSAV